MNRVTLVLVIAAAALLPAGWILVLASGYHGDMSGGSEIVWRIGGLMVYSVPGLVLLVALTAVARLLAQRCRRGHAASH